MLSGILSIQEVSAQCGSFNCNDTVNVSVNAMCEATLTPDIILENPDTSGSCSYVLTIIDPLTNEALVGNTISDQSLFNRPLKVSVSESGVANPNSCWGYVILEDKLPPDIVCAGNDTLLCTVIDTLSQESSLRAYLKNKIEDGLVDNCGNEEIEIRIHDNRFEDPCDSVFAAMRIVHYEALDIALNSVECWDTIFYIRVPLDSIDEPKHYTHDMALNCDDPFPTVEYLDSIDDEAPGENSMPNIDGINLADYDAENDLFHERGVCKFKISYTDLPVFELCGNTYKLVRRWAIIDWCDPNNPELIHQLIETKDDEVIIVENSQSCNDIDDQVADPVTCEALVSLRVPSIHSSECNDWTWTIYVQEPGDLDFTQFGTSRTSNTATVSRSFPIGISNVRYIVEDACENVDTCEFTVEVIDDTPPIAVCDYQTVITLNDNFLAKVHARSFDDGSYDICSGIVSYKVRRKDWETTECDSPREFDDFVKFCCADIGKTVLVELEVTDGAGHVGRCWAEAIIQYKGQGPNISCPAEIPIQDCRTYDDFDINTLQPPVISSSNPCIAENLEANIREVGRQINECGVGYIDIEWFLSLSGPDEVVCTERIHFENLDPFVGNDINFPSNRTVDACGSTAPLQSEIDDLYDPNTECSGLQYTTEDQTFENVNGVCLRIVRTWTVIDWCQFSSNGGQQSGIWTDQQTIDVEGSDAPVFDNAIHSISINQDQDNCRASVSALGHATDDCTDDSDLVWTHSVDLVFGNLTIPFIPSMPGREFVRTLDVGSYQINWTVSDGCGNSASASKIIEILDIQKPNPICVPSLEGNVSLLTGQFVVTVDDVDDGSFDNCDGSLELGIRRANTNVIPGPSITFTCNDLGVRQIELHATDDAGNTEFCIVFLSLQDAEGACGFGAGTVQVQGNIFTPNEVPIEDALVNVVNADKDQSYSMMTTIAGDYVFSDLNMYSNYNMTVAKYDNVINGVSTLDLILIQRHILGIRTFESPYQYIAADANNSESISASDLVVLRKLILGLISELPNNSSWRFIDKNFEFSNPKHPWPFDEGKGISTEDYDMNTNDFVGVKIGDVDLNAVANSGLAQTRSNKRLEIRKTVESRDNLKHFHLSMEENVDLAGLQLIMETTPDAQLVSVNSQSINLTEDQYSFKDGIFRLSWSDIHNKAFKEGEEFITLTFIANDDTRFDLDLNTESESSSEAYTRELQTMTLRLTDSYAQTAEVELYQNQPNPFSDRTSIDFTIPFDQEVTFTIFDISGNVKFESKALYVRGENRITVDRPEFGLNKGIYYYQIQTQSRSLVRKMIAL